MFKGGGRRKGECAPAQGRHLEDYIQGVGGGAQYLVGSEVFEGGRGAHLRR